MSPRQAIAAGCMALAAVAAGAHQADGHGNKSAVVVKEQKPWGIAGDRKAARRTVEITMTDTMRFVPDRLEVREGETLRLKVRNAGKMMHELVIGTRAELDGHAALMLKFPQMEHEEPYMIHVKPGATGELVWNFNRPGEFEFACLIAGHYQAGMVGRIKVLAKGEK